MRATCCVFLLWWCAAANATRYYVSNSTGSDANSGTSAGSAWATLGRVSSQTLANGDTVSFCQGDRWAGPAFVSTASGVTWNSYDCGNGKAGQYPVFTTGSLVPSGLWSAAPGLGSLVIQATLTGVTNTFKSVFVDSMRYIPARHPNLVNPLVLSGQAAEYMFGTDDDVNGVYTSSALSGRADNFWAGASLHIRNYAFWYTSVPITASTGSTVSFWSNQGKSNDGGIYIDRVSGENLTIFDAPREFIYQPSVNTLYLYAVDSATRDRVLSGQSQVWVAGVDNVFDLRGGSNAVQQLAFAMGNIGLVLEGNSIRVTNCSVSGMSDRGIYIQGSSGTIVEQSFVDDAVTTGIYSSQPGATIDSNTVTNIGVYGGWTTAANAVQQGDGIAVSGSSVTVQNNFIQYTGYTGIRWDGTGHTVRYNRILDSMQALSDGGAMYTFGSGSTGSQILGNTVDRVGVLVSGAYQPNLASWTGNPEGYCVYLDENSSGHYVFNNSCDHTVSCLFTNYGSNNQFASNVCYAPGVYVTSTGQSGNVFSGNTIVTHGTNGNWQNPLARVLAVQRDSNGNQICCSVIPATFQNNHYFSYAPVGSTYLFQMEYQGFFSRPNTLADWQSSGNAGQVDAGATFNYGVIPIRWDASPRSYPWRISAAVVTGTWRDSSGNDWRPDYFYSPAVNMSTVGSSITSTSDAFLYQTDRYAPTIAYAYPVTANQLYTVKFLWSENVYNQAGARVFDVSVAGQTCLSGLDLFVAAGNSRLSAYAYTCGPYLVSGPTLNIQLAATVDNAKVSSMIIDVGAPQSSSSGSPPSSSSSLSTGQSSSSSSSSSSPARSSSSSGPFTVPLLASSSSSPARSSSSSSSSSSAPSSSSTAPPGHASSSSSPSLIGEPVNAPTPGLLTRWIRSVGGKLPFACLVVLFGSALFLAIVTPWWLRLLRQPYTLLRRVGY